MKQLLSAYPQVLFIDLTYKLLKRKLVTLLVCVRDGLGLSQIVAVAWVKNEKGNTLKGVFNAFKSINPVVCSKTEAIMTDKDMTERAVLKEVFPNVDLFLCLFHALKSFASEITFQNMGVQGKERETILDDLNKLAKADCEKKYNYLYGKFQKSAPPKVLQYYDKNWHSRREEWVRYAVSKKSMGNYTNNPVETANAQLKTDIPPYSELELFVEKFFLYVYLSWLIIKKPSITFFFFKLTINSLFHISK